MNACNEDQDTYFDKALQSALHHGRVNSERTIVLSSSHSGLSVLVIPAWSSLP